jgi:hypothetical protein
MSISFDQFVELFPANDVVGGKVIVRVEGKHTVMGELTGHTFSLTAEGRAFMDARQEPAPAAAPEAPAEPEPDRPRRGRPPKAAE